MWMILSPTSIKLWGARVFLTADCVRRFFCLGLARLCALPAQKNRLSCLLSKFTCAFAPMRFYPLSVWSAAQNPHSKHLSQLLNESGVERGPNGLIRTDAKSTSEGADQKNCGKRPVLRSVFHNFFYTSKFSDLGLTSIAHGPPDFFCIAVAVKTSLNQAFCHRISGIAACPPHNHCK